MNLIKHKLGTAMLLAGSLTIASADPVVFNVNMSVQSALGYFNAGNGDTVRLLGLNGDWSTGVAMVPSAGDANIYTVTNDLAALSYPNYKFVIAPASGSWIWEDLGPGINRYFQVPSGGTNLPVVYFSDYTNMPSYSVEITFQVNMASAIELGNFTIGADYVSAFGSYDNWGQTGVLLTNVPGTSNYVGTLVSSALSTNNTLVSYKYAINGYGGSWEGNVGPNGASDRVFTVSNLVQSVGLDYWNNITNVSTTYNVTFTLDMVAQTALGHFTPGVDTVFVNGDWNWSGYAMQLFQSGSDTNLFTNTVALPYSPGTTVNYKYTVNGGALPSDWEVNGVGPGGANNRQFVLNAATNLPPDYFNNVTSLGPLTISRSGSQIILYWASGTNANNRIRLQNNGSLTGTWSDVSGSEGQSSVTNDFGSGPVFFRLTGP